MKPSAVELRALIEEVVGGLGYELVELKLMPRGRAVCVQVKIDHLEPDTEDQAISVGDCVRASRAIGAEPRIEARIPGRHVLEVSSPGIERPLTRPAHFRRFVGEVAVVRLERAGEGRRTVTGRIVAANDATVTLELTDGRDERLEVAHGDIQNARLKVDPWKPRERR
ncbi:MAG: ribosome maturation factor RimP [Candidatus Eiseniibacteriota bacterium]|jgi:ribosome maturation factor RimP